MTILVENSFNGVDVGTEIITEADGSKRKRWFVEGIFAQAEVINKNKRFYPIDLMAESINEYDRDYVKQNRAVGELSHPSDLEINLDKITHLTTSINREGNNFSGRAKILDTPCGKIVEGLLSDGVKFGVSTRAGGAVNEMDNGVSKVNKMKLVAVDIVFSPSAPDAMVSGLMEGAPYVWDTISEDEEFVMGLRNNLDTNKGYKDPEKVFEAFQEFMNRIQGIK
jgi:hypothetical protein